MAMEIILLVVAVFTGETFVKMEIRNYSDFASAKDGSCESYIGSAHFKKTLHIGKIKNAQVRATCIPASKLAGYNEMLKQSTSWQDAAMATPKEPVALIGTISYKPGTDNRKSVDAYLGLGLVIITIDGTFALYASDKVKEADLQKLDGKRVKVKAVFEDHTPAPGSIEQYPTDMQGKPMKRTGYRVLEIEGML